MKLILTTDVPGLGAPGDVVDVRDGGAGFAQFDHLGQVLPLHVAGDRG